MLMTQAVMAENIYMRMRVATCAAQEGVTEVGIDPDEWSRMWRKVWASAEGWDTKWEEAQGAATPSTALIEPGPTQVSGVPQAIIDIGQDPEVITDDMIRDQVRAMMPFTTVDHWKPEMNPMTMASRQFVQDMLDPHNRVIAAMMEALVDLRGGETLMIPPPPRTG